MKAKTYIYNRSNKRGGSTMILARNDLSSRKLYADVTANNTFEICVAYIVTGAYFGIVACLTVIIVVYKALWAKVDNSKKFLSALDIIIIKFTRVFLVGDFSNPVTAPSFPLDKLHRLSTKYNLDQLVLLADSPTRGNSLLYLVFVSWHLAEGVVNNLPPVVASDHDAQLITKPFKCNEYCILSRTRVGSSLLESIFGDLKRYTIFDECSDFEDYASRFNDTAEYSIGLECLAIFSASAAAKTYRASLSHPQKQVGRS